jgi:hypothetical protein
MNIKVPWWLWLVAAFVAVGGSVALGWHLRGRQAAEELVEIRERAATDSAAVDSMRAVLDDSTAWLADSAGRIRERVRTVRVEVPVAVARAEAAGATLEEHLAELGDTAGLRLYDEAEQAVRGTLALRDEEVGLLNNEILLLNAQLAVKDTIIVQQDAALARVRRDLAEALAAGEVCCAEPPWMVKAGGDLFEAGLVGTAAGVASKDVGVGIVTGLVSIGVKQLPKLGVSIF